MNNMDCATETTTKPSSFSLKDVFISRRRQLYPKGPWVSPIGFGTYRVGLTPPLGFPLCQQALEQALSLGCNLIDTSHNYGLGQSEILIGQTLSKQFAAGLLRRDQIVLVSKVGYIQGPNMEIAMTQEHNGTPVPDICRLSNAVWHCIHPQWIDLQLDRALLRLQCDSLDVYLLHNPEYMLKHFENTGLSQTEAQLIFLERMEESFRHLETLVQQGKIKAYGVSSNNFGSPENDFTHVSLSKINQIACKISEKNHFKVIQCPLNWLEPAAAFAEVEEGQWTVLSYAQKHGIGVLINRPFNAMYQDGLIRLTRPPTQTPQATLSPEMQQGLDNWTQLSTDIERMAHGVFADTLGYENAPLSQLVLATLTWLPGVSSVLCGMRRPDYVLDAQSALERPLLPYALQQMMALYENLEFHPTIEELPSGL